MSYETYFACLTCIGTGDWSLDNICCKKCKAAHDYTHLMKCYNLKKKIDRCDVCTNSIKINADAKSCKPCETQNTWCMAQRDID